MNCIVGIDFGGTPTDLHFAGGPGRCILKVPSTLQGPSIGLASSLESASLAPADRNARRQQGCK